MYTFVIMPLMFGGIEDSKARFDERRQRTIVPSTMSWKKFGNIFCTDNRGATDIGLAHGVPAMCYGPRNCGEPGYLNYHGQPRGDCHVHGNFVRTQYAAMMLQTRLLSVPT